jgi:hypothetical protein
MNFEVPMAVVTNVEVLTAVLMNVEVLSDCSYEC